MRGILLLATGLGLTSGLALLWAAALPWDAGWTVGMAAGSLLGTAGSLGGFWLLLRNLRASQARFLAAFFGGMLARWVVFGGMTALVLVRDWTPAGAFLGGLIPSYLAFQAMEMWYLHRLPGTAARVGRQERTA